MVTDRIIASLNQGIIPWHQPWRGGKGAFSYATGKEYSFINQLLLGGSGEWITFQQVKQAGGSIKKGAKASIVCFYKKHTIKEVKMTDDGEKEEIKTTPILKYFHVFRINDTTVEPTLNTDYVEAQDAQKDETADRIVADYVDRESLELIIEISKVACYSPSKDTVRVPSIRQYDSTDEFYSTLFHELVHSTGHKKRLNRDLGTGFGTKKYSREELIAEIGSAMLCSYAGLDDEKCFRNSCGYIQGWSKYLSSDPKAIVMAASRAEKAAKYILNIKDDETGNDQEA